MLEYEGRRTRKQYAIPVVYAESGSRIVALAATSRAEAVVARVSRAGAGDARSSAARAGRSRVACSAVRTDAPALRSYFERNPRAASSLGARGTPTDVELDSVPAAVVAFEPRG